MKPISLNRDILSKLLPELKNPRLMSLTDFKEYSDEQVLFIEDGFTFILRDDFNRDKVADIVFVGKYDNQQNPGLNTFISIISFKEKTIVREYMQTIFRDRIALLRVPEFKPRRDAIQMVFSFASDDCAFLYWSVNRWQFELCSDEVEKYMQNLPQ